MIKKKKAGIIVSVVLILTILFCIFGTLKYQSMRVNSDGFSYFENKLKEATIKNSEIDINKLTNFHWDVCFVFTPYYPSRDAYKKVGTEWTTAKTFIGFLISHEAENDTVNDEDFLMVFKKGDKIVLSKIYSINQLPVIFKLDNYEFTSNNAKFLVTDEDNVKELVLKK